MKSENILAAIGLGAAAGMIGAAVALAQLTPTTPPTTGTNVPNPLGGYPPTSMNFGPPWRLDIGNGQPVYRSGGNLPIVVVGHFDMTAGAAPPTWLSGGGGSASFDSTAQDSSFRVTTSSTASTSITVQFGNSPSVWTQAPRCQVEPEQSTTTNVWDVPTATQIAINWTGSVASAAFSVQCVGRSVN